jgi:hypothetical protein
MPLQPIILGDVFGYVATDGIINEDLIATNSNINIVKRIKALS